MKDESSTGKLKQQGKSKCGGCGMDHIPIHSVQHLRQCVTGAIGRGTLGHAVAPKSCQQCFPQRHALAWRIPGDKCVGIN